MKDYILEVCVDSVESALAAERGGATRLELCANLVIGGTTPGYPLFEQVKKETGLPVRTLIRPRFGDFLYTQYEHRQMIQDIRHFAQAGADGVVIGSLNADGTLNTEQMQEMMEAVQKIHETSKQVVGIIATIEEIADQTNLLSLNASIEAARAGEAGKGFAVVADEIGKLAQESSKAANMTRELIGVSMEEINKGNQIADHVMDSLKTAVEAVDNVNGMIQKTAGNAADQAQSMEQIRVGIEEISQGVQDNSAIAEESSATSEELASQATLLNELVQHFELQP